MQQPVDIRSLLLIADIAAGRLTGQVSRKKELGWEEWLSSYLSNYIRPPYADYHREFWDWIWSLRTGEGSSPFVAIWARGFGKSTSVESAIAAVAARQTRSYALYCMATQEQANDHVQNIAALFESPAFASAYPKVSSRKVGKYGSSLGWRRQRLRTANGFTLDAIGLDTASRGAKVEEDRPDLIILDDIDEVLDSAATIQKKIVTLTQSLLPARAPHAAVVFVQNLVHQDSIMSRLFDGRADFLAEREVSGPFPAVEDLAYEKREGGRYEIVGGRSTWAAVSLASLEKELNDIGPTSFLREKQHEVHDESQSMFSRIQFRHCKPEEVPPLERVVLWVDPAVTSTDQSDAHGIQADGLADNGDIYRLYSWEHRSSPEEAMRQALLKAVELKSECVGVETDQGGDTWISVYRVVWKELVDDDSFPHITKLTRPPAFRSAKAGGGVGPKAYRASQMLVDYERGTFVHVLGTHEVLERGLRRYLVRKPYDLVDAAYWSWHNLTRSKTVMGVY